MDEIKESIQLRYEKESKVENNLSCGNNLSFLKLSRGEKIHEQLFIIFKLCLEDY